MAADGSPTRRAQTQHAWNAEYQEALEYDAWGQVEEAVQCYHRLQVATSLESNEDKLALPAHRRAAIAQLAAALKLRMLELNSTRVQASTIGLAGMQSLSPFVAGLITSDVQLPATVAIALKSAAADSTSGPKNIASNLWQLRLQPRQQDFEDLTVTAIKQKDSTEHSAPNAKEKASTLQASSKSGTLRTPAQDLQAGDVTLSISFVSWSVKGAEHMSQPHVLLTVRDRRAKLLEAVQESPQVCVSRSGAPDKLDLDFVFHLQAPLNCLPEDAAVFMELQHWKADKRKMSIKCYAMLPYEELLRPGAAMLALYKKPADYKARVQRASYTSQPMYVHIIRTLARH